MTTSRSDVQPPKTPPRNAAGLDLYPQGIAQVEAERQRLGITAQMLERKRIENINGKF